MNLWTRGSMKKATFVVLMLNVLVWSLMFGPWPRYISEPPWGTLHGDCFIGLLLCLIALIAVAYGRGKDRFALRNEWPVLIAIGFMAIDVLFLILMTLAW